MPQNIKQFWQEIDTVLLDMDGTILDLAFDNFFWREYLPQIYAQKNNLDIEQSRQFLADSYQKIEGKLQWYCLDFWSERLSLDIAQLKYQVRDRVSFRPQAIDFLEFLKSQNKTVYLVTNAHPKSLEIKLLTAQFNHYFNDLNSSHEFSFPKEDQAYWLALHQKYQFNPDKTLFIDDSNKILKAAQKFGIKELMGIAQPDLSQGIIDSSPFKAINQFSELIINE